MSIKLRVEDLERADAADGLSRSLTVFKDMVASDGCKRLSFSSVISRRGNPDIKLPRGDNETEANFLARVQEVENKL